MSDETLIENIKQLRVAIGDRDPFDAYRHSSEVKRIADEILASKENMVRHLVQKIGERTKLYREKDVFFSVGMIGTSYTENENIGGLLGAILTADPHYSEKEMLSYFDTKIDGSVNDYINFIYKRRKKSKTRSLDSLSDTEENNDRRNELHGRYFGVGALEQEDAMLTEKPMVSLAMERLPAADQEHIFRVANDFRRSRHLSMDPTIRSELKFAFLQNDDEHVTPMIAKARKEIIDSQTLEEMNLKIYRYLDIAAISLTDLAKRGNFTQSAMSNNKGVNHFPPGLIPAIGLREEHLPEAEWAEPYREQARLGEADPNRWQEKMDLRRRKRKRQDMNVAV